MARPYTVNITDGVATARILSGNYTITSNTNGYLNTSIDPNTLVIDKTTGEYSFTIEADGTLTFHITEDGTTTGTPIIGATLIRCDKNGNEYGNPITTDDNGNAVFNNVPYAESNAPLIYYKQKTGDGEHEFDETLKNTSMTTTTATVEIQNEPALLRTINLVDTNYENLPIELSTITLS